MSSLWIQSTPLLAVLCCVVQPSLARAQALPAENPPALPAPAPASSAPASASSTAAAAEPEKGSASRATEPASAAPPAASPASPASSPPALLSVFRRTRSPHATAKVPASHAEGLAEPSDDDGRMGSHQRHFYGMVGYRGTRVTGDGYQPFSTNQAFHQASVSIGRVLYGDGPLSFALGLGWDYGASSADVRGADTTLEAQRFTVIPELRYHLLRRLYGFGRLGAGVALVGAELSDSVTETTRSSDRLGFTLDGSVGAAFEVIGEPSGASRQPRVWVLLDGGYVFNTATKTVLENDSDVPARSEARAFADLNLSGFSGRLSAALTF